MDKMIVGIDYTQDGNRTVALIDYFLEFTDRDLTRLAKDYIERYDEVYIVDFNPNCKEFIDEIVLKGCRV